MRTRRARVWRIARRLAAALAAVLLLLLAPVAYLEVACRGDARPQTYVPLLTDSAWHRTEANSYLTYPEWHIVYAYDGLAATLERGDEHAFGYISSVAGFWRSACALMRVADEHGGADWPTRSTIHTIGVSFTAEMAMKAAYEETIGRASAWLRGGEKTPQDEAIARGAADYSAFLRQTPWYRYPFDRERRRLWAAPVDGVVRGWERRLGIGLEYTAKQAYAAVLAGAVAATGQADLTIRSVVADIDAETLQTIPDVTIIGARGDALEIETPRYARFTQLLADIARRGGTILEIAGNDDIMLALIVERGANPQVQPGTVILRLPRDGFPSDRLLVDLKVRDLAAFLRAHPTVDHIYDY